MIAALPMYDRPETAAANDRFWDFIASQIPDAPKHLTRGGDLWAQWRAPDLVLSQTCGYPYRAQLHGQVTLVATPVWDLPCPPGYYDSVLVVRAEDPRTRVEEFDGAALAYNEPLSQSGWAAPQIFAASKGIVLRPGTQSGGHKASTKCVAEGRDDIAAIDAVTWEMIQRFDPWAAALRVLDRTPPTPTLPYITARHRDPHKLRHALASAVTALAPEDRALLCIAGVTFLPAADYLAVATPPDPTTIAAKTHLT